MIGNSPGKWDSMMLVSSCHESLLNILVTRSTKIAARMGVWCFHCGCWMNLLTERIIALMMKSMPPLILTSKLNGRRYWASPCFILMAMCVAMSLLIAVGMPIGWSFQWSCGTLCRQKRYVSVKNCLAWLRRSHL